MFAWTTSHSRIFFFVLAFLTLYGFFLFYQYFPSVASSSESSSFSWSYQRKYGIVIDAGSSGSRVFVYSWRDQSWTLSQLQNTLNSATVLPHIESGVEYGNLWQLKQEPGLSSFASNPSAAGASIIPLLQRAQEIIPKSLHDSTPIFLFATAGLRLVTPSQQKEILTSVCSTIQSASSFSIEAGCETHVKVITGETEGIYGWLAVNYMLGKIPSLQLSEGLATGNDHTFGFLDMGGASTQLAFEPTVEESRLHKDDLITIRLYTIDGKAIEYQLFVATWLGFGMNEAKKRYLELINKDSNNSDDGLEPKKSNQRTIMDPCSPAGMAIPEYPDIVGSGSFDKCVEASNILLNATAPCPSNPCLFNGVHSPLMFPNMHHFVGVSEYWYTSNDVFRAGGLYDKVTFGKKASDYCSTSWISILDQYGGQGKISESRLRDQCFKSAWLVNILHNGFGIGREGSIPGNGTMRSIDEIGGVSVSWTLGALLANVVSNASPKNHFNIISGLRTKLWLISLIAFIFAMIGILCISRIKSNRWNRNPSAASVMEAGGYTTGYMNIYDDDDNDPISREYVQPFEGIEMTNGRNIREYVMKAPLYSGISMERGDSIGKPTLSENNERAQNPLIISTSASRFNPGQGGGKMSPRISSASMPFKQ